MITKTKKIDLTIYKCESCSMEWDESNYINKCDICKKEICSDCSYKVYEMFEKNEDYLMDLLMGLKVYDVCESCNKKIELYITSMESRFEQFIKSEVELYVNEMKDEI